MGFSKADEKRLIAEVSKHSLIYDTSHFEYRNYSLKDKVWKTIGKEIGKHGGDCKKKWRVIRDAYTRFKSKGKLGIGAPKNSKNHRHQLLSFIDGVSQHKPAASNIPTTPEKETADSDKKQVVGEFVDVLTSSNEIMYSDEENETSSNKATDSEKPIEEEIIKSNVCRPRLKKKVIKLFRERNDRRETLLTSIIKNKGDDVEWFCRHIAEVLRNLPPLEKAEAKKELGMIVAEYEIKAARNAPSLNPLTNYKRSPEHQSSSSTN